MINRATANEGAGHCKSGTETGAACRDVESSRTLDAELVGDDGRSLGSLQVPRRRRDDHGTDLLGCNAADVQCFTRRADRHREDAFTFAGEPARLDTRSRLDPLVGGIDQLADLGVGHDSLRAVNAEPEKDGLPTSGHTGNRLTH